MFGYFYHHSSFDKKCLLKKSGGCIYTPYFFPRKWSEEKNTTFLLGGCGYDDEVSVCRPKKKSYIYSFAEEEEEEEIFREGGYDYKYKLFFYIFVIILPLTKNIFAKKGMLYTPTPLKKFGERRKILGFLINIFEIFIYYYSLF